MTRVQKLYHYHEDANMINYQKMSIDLGLHLHSFEYLRSHHSRQQDIQRLRNLYSATEKKRPLYGPGNEVNTMTLMKNNASVTPRKGEEESTTNFNRSVFINQEHESTSAEVKDIILRRQKNFRDLIVMYQRKNPLSQVQASIPVIPLQEFRILLRTIGINLSQQTLKQFLTVKDGASI